MKVETKKILSLLLVFCLVLALTPLGMTTALAADISVGDESALTNALNTATTGDTIKLTANIDYSQGISINGKSIIFNLNGFNLNVTNTAATGIGLAVTNGGVGLTGSSGKFNVTGSVVGVRADNSTITVTSATATKDSGTGAAASNGGFITVNGNATGGGYGAVADSGSTVVVNGDATGTTATDGIGALAVGGSVTINGNAKGVYYGACANGNSGNSLVTINGGNAIGTGPYSFGAYAVFGGKINVTGNVQGIQYGVYSSENASVTVTGNAMVTAVVNGWGVDAEQKGTIAIGGNVVANGSSLGAYVVSGGVITIEGTIQATNYIKIFTADMAVSAGNPTTKPGYLTYSTVDGTVYVKVAVSANVAEINGTQYATLDAALSAVQNGQTIKLLNNINQTKGITIDGKSFDFDLNGYDLSITETGSSIVGLLVKNGGKVGLTGSGKFDVSGALGGVEVHNASVTVTNAASSGGYGVYAIEGGKITVKGNTTGYWKGACASGTGSDITVTGDATATASSGIGADADSGGSISIGGDAQGVSTGVRANQLSSTITVTGNVTATGNNSCGAYTYRGMVVIGGNVTSTGTNGTGAWAEIDGKITIDAAITATNYIKVNATIKTAADKQTTTTKTGYFTYIDAASTVWVKDTLTSPMITGMTLNKTSLPQAGGTVAATVTGTNLDAAGTVLQVSLDGGMNKIGTVSSNTSTSAVIEFVVPENTMATDRTDTVTLYLNGTDTGRSVTITVAAYVTATLPDLAITSGTPTVNVTTVAAGGTVTLSDWTVKNIGTLAAGKFYNGFYLSKNQIIRNTDTRLSYNSNSGLAAGASFTWSSPTLTIPASTEPGTYYLGILVNYDNSINESDSANDSNNYVSVPITVTASTTGTGSTTATAPLPDLAITSGIPTASVTTVAPGGTVTLSDWTVKNIGTLAAGKFYNGFYLSKDPIITNSDTRLSYNNNSGLAAGASFTWSSPTLTIPTSTTPGTYYLGILVNYDNSVKESDSANNYVSVKITVAEPLPDLAITSGTPTASVTTLVPGGIVTLSDWTVKNIGTLAAGKFYNGFYLSEDPIITNSDTRLSYNNNSGLAAGASFTWSSPTLTIPTSTTPGTYYLGILVNYDNSVKESDSANNYVSVPITVVEPITDLAITSGTPAVSASTVEAGSKVTLSSWTVKNIGTLAAGKFYNGFYLSKNQIIRNTDTRLSYNNNSGLAAGASFTWSSPTLTIPASTAPGTYYLGILVNYDNSVNESDSANDSNNYVSVPITVNQAPSGTTTSFEKLAAFVFDSNKNITDTISLRTDNTTGIVSVNVDSSLLTAVFGKSKPDGIRTNIIKVDIPKIDGAKVYEPILPASFFTAGDTSKAVKIMTDIAAVTVPYNMLTTADVIGARNVSVTIAAGGKSKLDSAAQAQIGNRPVIELNLKIDGRQTSWSNESVPVTITIPYMPTTEELKDPEHIVIWYMDGSGKAVAVPNGRFDFGTGTVTFTTTHFSSYAVANVHKSFSDLGNVEWSRKAIEVMASKGIINGTSATTYSPASNITRADYLVLLVKTLGLTAEFDSNFDDVGRGTYYYEAAGIAKKLGIAVGSGNNRFNPKENISRQDMIVLTAKALEVLKGLKAAGDSTVLDKFNDKRDIAGYAVESLATLVKEGLISGFGDKLTPRVQTTRAEAAVLLYQIYNKYPG